MYSLTGHLSLHREQPQLFRVLHWAEQGKLPTDAKPEVNRLEPMVYTLMTEPVQWMQFDMLFWHYRRGDRSNITQDEIRIMESVYRGSDPGRFITNGQGLETHANYISRQRLDQPDPAQMSLVCGGNVLTGAEERLANGNWQLVVTTLTGAARVQEVNRDMTPWFCQVATIYTPNRLPDGSYQVNAFTQLGGRAGYPVIVPVLCDRRVTIPMNLLEKLPRGAPIPSPYNPP